MTPLSTRMVEAAARALSDISDMGWQTASEYQRDAWREQARASLTAGLAVAEAEGAMLCVVGAEIEGAGPLLVADNDRMRLGMVYARASGWNAHRAATLDGRVTL